MKHGNSWVVGGVPMPLPIILGAGVCKAPARLVPYMRDDVSLGAVITGSYTPDEADGEPRKGNDDGKNICQWPPQLEGGAEFQFGLNSWGMPNMGFTKAENELARTYLPRKVIVSIAAFSVNGYVDGAQIFGGNPPWSAPRFAAQEWNLGCPNTHDKKALPISYDYDSFEQILAAGEKLKLNCPVWVKVSPYLTLENLKLLVEHGIDVTHVPVAEEGFLERVAALIARYPYVRAVVVSNTGPNAVYRVNGESVTTPNAGKAGLSGPIMKEIVFEQVRRFRAVLPETVDVIHSGGLWTGDDLVSAIENGAAAGQFTSLPSWGGGPKVFGELIAGSERLQNLLTN